MKLARIVVIVVFIAILAVPFLFGGRPVTDSDHLRRVIIITPHNEQIRHEFEHAFRDWHLEKYGERVDVVWSTPGGTSEIRKMLQAQYTAALRSGGPVGGNADLVFGGGQFEHDQLKAGVSAVIDGQKQSISITQPVEFSDDALNEWFGGRRSLDTAKLFDEDGFWFGTALSGFGIVYNRDILKQFGINEPRQWQDLADPDLFGLVALGNPGMSGSIRKSFDTVLQRTGWRDGWRILRRAGANARYFSASSPKIPIDVSMGDAAAGVCIDFYGRYQSQAISDAGGGDRVGYVDPRRTSAIDADPISMLRGAPNPELARRFIEFTLTEQGQALWQFPRGAQVNGIRGPIEFELRRLPIRLSMYRDELFEHFIDSVNLFAEYESASGSESFNRAYWAFVPLLFHAITIDTHEELQKAWQAIVQHPAYPPGIAIVTADDVHDANLKQMLRLFDDLPIVPGPDGSSLDLDDVSNLGAISTGWLDGEWRSADLWDEAANPTDVLRVDLTRAIKQNYRRVVRLAGGSA